MRPDEKANEHEKIYERWGELKGGGVGGKCFQWAQENGHQ